MSGRDRINMNGSIDPEDVTDVQMVEKDTINAESTKELFQILIDKNPEATKIYVICDNARYYHNKILQKWVKEAKI